MFKVSEAYRERKSRFIHVHEAGGWRLKCYSVQYGEGPLQQEIYDLGLRLALDELPESAVAEDRSGVGFVIFHQGRDDHYLVLNWWGLENELFNRVYVREISTQANWRKAVDRGIACVWDMQIFWHERQAYVRHVLSRPDDPALAAYLDDTFETPDYHSAVEGISTA